MWDRTLTVGSAGKSFAATGWRVGAYTSIRSARKVSTLTHSYLTGWLIGPPELTLATLQASTRIIFCTNSPLQEAVAAGLEKAEEHNFFPDQIRAYTERRDTLTKYFDELGLSYTVPEGSYFVLVNIEKIKPPKDYNFPAVVKGRGADFE